MSKEHSATFIVTEATRAASVLNRTRYSITKRTGLSPATVHRFFANDGKVRLETAQIILSELGLSLAVVPAK